VKGCKGCRVETSHLKRHLLPIDHGEALHDSIRMLRTPLTPAACRTIDRTASTDSLPAGLESKGKWRSRRLSPALRDVVDMRLGVLPQTHFPPHSSTRLCSLLSRGRCASVDFGKVVTGCRTRPKVALCVAPSSIVNIHALAALLWSPTAGKYQNCRLRRHW
jgi:hypothetical protein